MKIVFIFFYLKIEKGKENVWYFFSNLQKSRVKSESNKKSNLPRVVSSVNEFIWIENVLAKK